MDQLGLLETVEGFGERVVVSVAARAHRGDDVGGAQTFRVANAEVLDSSVRMKNYLGEVLSAAQVDRQLQGVDREV